MSLHTYNLHAIFEDLAGWRPHWFATPLKAPVCEAVVPIAGLIFHIAFAAFMATIAQTTVAVIATSIADRWPRYHTTATAATKVTQA